MVDYHERLTEIRPMFHLHIIYMSNLKVSIQDKTATPWWSAKCKGLAGAMPADVHVCVIDDDDDGDHQLCAVTQATQVKVFLVRDGDAFVMIQCAEPDKPQTTLWLDPCIYSRVGMKGCLGF